MTRQQKPQGGAPDVLQRDHLLRQKRFALVLSGDEVLAMKLVERLVSMGNASPHGGLSSAATQYAQLKKLYELWVFEAKNSPQVAHIFQSGKENEAIQKGLDPSIAKVMGELPSLHRALLLLIYGEQFSYAATAQLLNITIEELMTALALARGKFSQEQVSVNNVPGNAMIMSGNEVANDTA